jgi:hypothetical protein
MSERRNIILISFLLTCALALVTSTASAQTPTTFTYQGRLTDGGTPANVLRHYSSAIVTAIQVVNSGEGLMKRLFAESCGHLVYHSSFTFL